MNRAALETSAAVWCDREEARGPFAQLADKPNRRYRIKLPDVISDVVEISV
jgi:hypothetical protein